MHRSPFASSTGNRPAGFTLIELLVVIAIIGVLAALLLPIYNKVAYTAKKVQVVNDTRNIRTAVVAYYNDYKHYPLSDGQRAGAGGGSGGNGGLNLQDTVFGDHYNGNSGTYSSADLFDVLRAIGNDSYSKSGAGGGQFNANNILNPSQTVYWTGQLAQNPTKPRNGITTQKVTIGFGPDYIHPGAFVDSWGSEYIIFFDATQNGDLTAAVAKQQFYVDYINNPTLTVQTGLPPLGVEIASMGADGQFGTKISASKGDHLLYGSDDIVTWQH